MTSGNDSTITLSSFVPQQTLPAGRLQLLDIMNGGAWLAMEIPPILCLHVFPKSTWFSPTAWLTHL